MDRIGELLRYLEFQRNPQPMLEWFAKYMG